MSGETLSVIVWCWHDPQTDSTHLRVVRTDTAEEVHLNDSTFLLRVSPDESARVGRCFIRHLTSGREAYIQSGPKLRAFIKDCLLKSDETTAAPPDGQEND
jgi:hypothetical protein